MVLTDRELRTLNQELTAQNKPLISDAKSDQFFSIGYDLTTSGFYVGQEAEKSNISLAPNDSVFVKSKEVIDLPSDVMAYVSLRNSRIRQGLSLTAPIYQPAGERCRRAGQKRQQYRNGGLSADSVRRGKLWL